MLKESVTRADSAQAQACGLCGSGQFEIDPQCRERLPGTDGLEVHLCRCSACGLRAYQPQFSPERLAGFYDREYYQAGYIAMEHARRRLIQSAIDRRLAKYFPPGARILDVGAGAGFWLDALAARGCRVEAFERSQDARQLLSGKGYQVTDVWDEARGPYDVALLMDVLGHIPHAGATLDRIRERLRPGGLIIIRAPYYQGAWRRYQIRRAFRQGDVYPGFPTILWRFEPAGLMRSLVRDGFDSVTTFYEIQPWSDGGRRDRVFRWACAALDYLSRRGDEFYVIARKKGAGV